MSAVPAEAMVLAAGLGRRMLPLTETRPKPLVEVAGKPLIDHALDRLRAAGVGRAVVNAHYLADRLEEHLSARDWGLDIAVSDERERLMETGGGMVRALPLIAADPFLVVNSDNLWTDGAGEEGAEEGGDSLRLLAGAWDEARMDALLLLAPMERAFCHKGQGDFFLEEDGRLRRRGDDPAAPFVYTGIQIVSKRLLAPPVPEGPFSTNILWDRALAEGRLFGAVHRGLWFDVGAPENIAMTEEVLGRYP